MRDIIVFSSLVCLLIAAIKRPQVGILAWIWVAVMNPHRLSWGWLTEFPVNDMVAIVTIGSCIAHWQDRRSIEFTPVVTLIYLFFFWASLTTVFSVDFQLSFTDWSNFAKSILLITLVLLFMNERHWLIAAMGVFTLSIAFVGVKGGLFTILTGGAHRVWGPPGTVWGSNNAVSIAMLMIIPLLIAFRHIFVSRIFRLAMIFAAILSFAALLGTQSRGGLVGLLGMGLVMILRSRRKFAILLVIAVSLPLGFYSMPDSWKQRMASIENYEEDTSSMTRIIMWRYAVDIANERPLFGNGFEAFFYPPYHQRYMAWMEEMRSVHSNYFQVLGEQGYVGLVLYLVLMAAAVLSAGKWSRVFLRSEETRWASPFVEMLQFSIAGYAFNGLTVNLAYVDLYYLLLVFLALLISYNKRVMNLADAPVNSKAPVSMRYGH